MTNGTRGVILNWRPSKSVPEYYKQVIAHKQHCCNFPAMHTPINVSERAQKVYGVHNITSCLRVFVQCYVMSVNFGYYCLACCTQST